MPDNIDNGSLAAPPAAAPAAPAATPVPPSQINQPTIAELQAQLDQLKTELESTNAKNAEALAEERLKVAAAMAKQPATKLGNGVQDLQLHKAIQQVGGLAYWNQLSPAQKSVALGVTGSEQVKDADLRRVFGATSSSIEAQRLARQNPKEYSRLRAIAKSRGIL